MSASDFWDDLERAKSVSQKFNNIKDEIKRWDILKERINDITEYLKIIDIEDEAFKKELGKELAEIDFLVLDEVGRLNPTDFARATWSEIVDRRYTNANTKTTIWLSNMPPETVMDDYQVDRIKDSRFVVAHVDGLSYRQTDVRIEEDELWWQKL